MMWFVGHGSFSPEGESLSFRLTRFAHKSPRCFAVAVPTSNQKASPCTPLLPPLLAEHAKAGGMRQRRTKASLSLRTVRADDAGFYSFATARCSGPQSRPKGRLVRQQLFGKSLVSYGHKTINWHLSTLGIVGNLAHMKWAFQEKAVRRPDARHPGSSGIHCTGIKVDFAKLRNPDGSIRAKVSG